MYARRAQTHLTPFSRAHHTAFARAVARNILPAAALSLLYYLRCTPSSSSLNSLTPLRLTPRLGKRNIPPPPYRFGLYTNLRARSPSSLGVFLDVICLCVVWWTLTSLWATTKATSWYALRYSTAVTARLASCLHLLCRLSVYIILIYSPPSFRRKRGPSASQQAWFHCCGVPFFQTYHHMLYTLSLRDVQRQNKARKKRNARETEQVRAA